MTTRSESRQEGVERWTLHVCENCRSIVGRYAVVHLVGRTVATERECGRVVQVEVAPVSELHQALSERDEARAHAIEANGALEPETGLLRLTGEADPQRLLRALVAAHDHLRRIIDGEDYVEKWKALGTDMRLDPDEQLPESPTLARVSELEGALERAGKDIAAIHRQIETFEDQVETGSRPDPQNPDNPIPTFTAYPDDMQALGSGRVLAEMSMDAIASALSPSLGDE